MILKRITNLLGRTFRENYDNNLAIIESEDRKRQEDIKKTNARLDNVILNSSDLPEVVDARGTHNLLGTRLNSMDEEIESNSRYIETENAFDISVIQPEFFTVLNLYEATVLQSMLIDIETGIMYATQVSGDQDFTITRMSKSGSFIDHMKIPFGGHGTTIGLQKINGNPYIWSNRHVVDASGNITGSELVRFQYKPNTTLTSFTTYNKFTKEYLTPTIDQHNKYIAFRVSPTIGNMYVELRKLSDVQNGVDNLLGRVGIPSDLSYLQGFTIDGYDLYWYTGDTNSVQYPNEITQFNFMDGQIKKRMTVDFGLGPKGKYEDNFREPESIFLYRDPNDGTKSLFAGVVTGEEGKRIAKIYAYHQKNNKSKFATNVLEHAQLFALSNGTETKGIPEEVTALKNMDTPGYYYMDTEEAEKYTDHPYAKDAGWFFNVSPKAQFGAFIQAFLRNSTGRVPKFGLRVVNKAGDVSPMLEFTSNSNLEWQNLSLKNGAKSYSGGRGAKFAVNGGLVIIRMDVVIGHTLDSLVISSLPSGLGPSSNWYQACPIGGTTGIQKMYVRPNGDIVALGIIANVMEEYTHTFVDMIVPLG